ncbi:MAG: porin family protein [Adhaeribacter sp.]
MKKIICLLLAGMSCSLAGAQSLKFGLKGGLNYSNVAGNLQKEEMYNNKISFHGGVSANIGLIGQVLSLQPELLYSQKGYNYLNEEAVIDGLEHENKGKRNFSYVDLPVLLRVKARGFFVEAGPQIGYLAGVQDKKEVSVNNIEDKDVQWLSKEGMKEWEAGYVAGLGFAANNGLSLGLRYNGRLDSLVKEDKANWTNARHSVVQLQLGFQLSQ